MKQLCHRRTQSTGSATSGGFALTELLLTVAIIAVVLGTIANIAQSEVQQSTATTEGRVIRNVINELQVILTRQPSFESINTESTIDMELWPDRYVVNPTTLVNAWEGGLSVSVDPAFDPNNKGLLIELNDIPDTACPSLATYSFQADRIAIDGRSNIVFNSGFSGASQALSLGDIAASCSGDSNTLFIWFAKDID